MSDDNKLPEIPTIVETVEEVTDQIAEINSEPEVSTIETLSPTPLELIEALQELPNLQIRELDYKNTTTNPEELSALLGGSDAPVTLAKNPLFINFRDRVFISFVKIKGNKALPGNVSIDYLTLNDQWKPGRITNNHNTLTVEISSNAKALRINKTGNYFTKTIHINRIEVYGFSGFGNEEWQKNFEIFSAQVDVCNKEFKKQNSEIDLARKEIEAERISNQDSINHQKKELETEKAAWKIKTEALEAEQVTLTSSIELQKSELVNATQAATTASTELTLQNSKLTDAMNRKEEFEKKSLELEKAIQEGHSNSESLNRKIADKKLELEKLNNDIALFATNLKDYGTKGQKQINTYILLILLFASLGLWTACMAFSEVDTIWAAIVTNPKEISWSLIAITRVGLFIIFGAIIGALSTLSYSFVQRIIEIHDRSLRLSEISILAKDTIDATLLDTNATAEQRLSVFYATRMTLIRNLLSGTFEKLVKMPKSEKDELSEDFKKSDTTGIARALLAAGVDIAKLAKAK